MIILDTNIVSEFMGSPTAPQVKAWLDEQDRSRVHLTSINVAEILAGLAIMPPGRKQLTLRSQFDGFERFAICGRILAFERVHAGPMAEFIQQRRALGLGVDFADSQIAAIAKVNDAVLVTRNTKDFEGVGLTLVNPFEHSG